MLPLGSRAFDTLVTLIRHRDRVVEKDDFLREAWRGAVVEESNLTKQISLLRKMLEDTPSSHRYIVTVPGTGYRFVAQVDEREATDEPVPVDLGSLNQRSRLLNVRYALLATVGAIVLGAIVGKMTMGTTRPGASASPSLLWQLTFDKGVQADPAWSPDGLRIAYSSDRSGYADIWLQPVDGGQAVQLTQSSSPDVEPDWSPDGTRLVFATLGVGGGIRVMSSAGGPVHEIAPFGNSPRWSPDGSSILFTRSDWGPARLYVSTLDGAPPRPVLEEFLAPFVSIRFAWHPDSRHVSVWGVRPGIGIGFWTIALDGTDVTRSAIAPGVLAELERSALSFREVDGTSNRLHLVASRRCPGVRRDVARCAQPLESRRGSQDARLDPGTRAVDHVIRSQREAPALTGRDASCLCLAARTCAPVVVSVRPAHGASARRGRAADV